MAKGKSKGKSAEKKQTNWSKIILSLFLAVTMIIVIFAYAFVGGGPKTLNTDRTLTLTKSFNSISDGLKLVPDNASYVRYANLSADSTLSSWMGQNFWTSMPNSSTFDATIKRDMLTVYPKDTFGNFSETYNRNFSMQYVSLTDFGTGYINTSWTPMYEIDGQLVYNVNYLYYYTPQTNPVVNGMVETVAPVLDVMTGNKSNSSYGQYEGLFDQLGRYHMSEDGMTLEVVSDQPTAENYTDMFYAGIGPNHDANKTYTFQAVMHLNRSLTDSELELFSILPEYMKQKSGYTSYNVSYTTGEAGDYVVVKSVGPFDATVNDMYYTWGFMRY